MIKEEEAGKKLADNFAGLSDDVDFFRTSLEAELQGIDLTAHLQASADSCIQEIRTLRSKLGWYIENLKWSLGIAAGGAVLLTGGIAIGCCGAPVLLATGIAAVSD
ncbi:hypothetical protein CPB86DRAFT_357669 [Serendipita vermifera]|nr:hypothetical protein CPB86DRAFT_357669 [Serendipita vermifera]